jgi:3'(2'), 5'-bisphosphate nucleotidase
VPANTILNQDDIDYVSQLIVEAGCLAPEMRANIQISEKTGPYDRVTSADVALSKLIVRKLVERFPTDRVISEEDSIHCEYSPAGRTWLVDPIDGTDNYISNDGQYSVMIGLLLNMKPVFGWVFAPTTSEIYFGGPDYGSWKRLPNGEPIKFSRLEPLVENANVRLMVGFRDRKNNPWITDLPGVTFVQTGSIGLKVAKVLDNEADLFIHLSGKLKTWDTAGPSAIALGSGLDVGGMDSDELIFPNDGFLHNTSVIIGRPGALAWCRERLFDMNVPIK